MRKNSTNQGLISRESAMHHHVQALEQGDIGSIAIVLESALDAPKLERIIAGFNLAYQKDEQFTPIATEAELVTDVLHKYLPNAFETDEEGEKPIPVTDTSTGSDMKSHLLPADQQANRLLLGSSVKNKLSEHLNQLVAEARKHKFGTIERQQGLTQILQLIVKSGKLWKNNAPYYQDALQQTWLYFCNNICEVYDPTRGSVITWLNTYLKWRLYDFENNKLPISYQFPSDDRGDFIDPIDLLVAPPDVPPILEAVRSWAEADSDGELGHTHIKGHPFVNCQVLILRRLPPEVNWRELSIEFGLQVSTLCSFYQRQCLPRLRKFAEKEGYL